MSKTDRARIYSDFLHSEGYTPKIDKDGDIVFKYEGKTYLIIVDDKDDEFFRIVFPSFWPIESQEERARVEKAALVATAETKVAKVFPVRDDVWATIELFCSPPENANFVFNRSMLALRTAVGKFVEEMRK